MNFYRQKLTGILKCQGRFNIVLRVLHIITPFGVVLLYKNKNSGRILELAHGVLVY